MLKSLLERALILALLVWLSVWPSPSGAESGVPLYFVQITDTHLGERDHLERTRQLVERINRPPYAIACVVHTGDVFADTVTDPVVREAGLAALRRLRPPLHLLPGNRDILPQDLERTAAAYTRRVGPLLHQAGYRGVVFVMAYTDVRIPRRPPGLPDGPSHGMAATPPRR